MSADHPSGHPLWGVVARMRNQGEELRCCRETTSVLAQLLYRYAVGRPPAEAEVRRALVRASSAGLTSAVRRWVDLAQP